MNNDNELQPSTGEGMQPTIGDVPVGRMQTERPEANEPTDGAEENVTTQQEVTTAKEDTANTVETVAPPAELPATTPTPAEPEPAPPAPPRKDNGCLLAVLGALCGSSNSFSANGASRLRCSCWLLWAMWVTA